MGVGLALVRLDLRDILRLCMVLGLLWRGLLFDYSGFYLDTHS